MAVTAAPVAVKLLGPVQVKVAPVVPEVPVRVVLVCVQVSAVELAADTVAGGVVLEVTVTLAVPHAVAVVTIRV